MSGFRHLVWGGEKKHKVNIESKSEFNIGTFEEVVIMR